MEETIADATYKRLACMYGSQKNHIVKVELGQTTFNLYNFVKMINCFK